MVLNLEAYAEGRPVPLTRGFEERGPVSGNGGSPAAGRAGASPTIADFAAVLAAPGARDVAVVIDDEGPRLTANEAAAEPAVLGDPVARLLFL